MAILTAKLGTSQLNMLADIVHTLPVRHRMFVANFITAELVARGVNPKFKRHYFMAACLDGVKKKRPSRSDK
jgi:hypothetical protein